jgi:formamidopyrimidine-DNA glycosylase
MPELPDITVYIEALEARIQGERLAGCRVASPFLLRTVEPTLADLEGKRVVELRRVGKRIAIGLEDAHWMVLHLMIAGRLHWKAAGAALPGKRGLAAFDSEPGTLILTEAGSKRRASLHIVKGAEALAALDPGGLEVLETTAAAFGEALRRNNHTLKRALTDPRLLSGIGNAFSDEILHAARLSPIAMTQKLTDEEIACLFEATCRTLTAWTATLREAAAGEFPDKVTAFRAGMAVHGRYGKPCPVCDTPVQRIR